MQLCVFIPYYPLQKWSWYPRSLLCLLTLMLSLGVTAQVRWDGEAGDGQWTTALNWVNNQVPAATDDVLFDNSLIAGNYAVHLPGANTTITVRTIIILPATATTIQLHLPASSTAAPALVATGPGYGIVINNGGLLLNSSGISAGAAIAVNDSMRINNGGQYTHNTRSAHAALVTVLSKQPGTEKGIFKFEPPGGGYTFSSTGRTYGTLIFSAVASSGSLIYASSAASPLTINGDLIIEAGVTVNLDITAPTTIKGNYLQLGGVFNLASQPNNNTVFIKGDLIQKAGTITETATGFPSIELNGSTIQNIETGGIINNSVGFTVNNPAGVVLQSALLLPYKLNLLNGIVNTQSFLVTLLAGCTISADSSSNNSFINGSMRKEGLLGMPYFLFPVGKGTTQRWLELKNVTGNYTVEFFKANPHTLSATTGAGIHHFSSIEYWSVLPDVAPIPVASVELSFDNVNSGGVTDLATLRVAQLQAPIWMDAGNSATTGSAGSAGAVVSNGISFQSSANYFTLASSDAFQNALPLQLLSFNASRIANAVELKWVINSNWQSALFELQSSVDGNRFVSIATIPAVSNQLLYRYLDDKSTRPAQLYRLRITERGGLFSYSNNVKVAGEAIRAPQLLIVPTLVHTTGEMVFNSPSDGNARLMIYTSEGRTVIIHQVSLKAGINKIPVYLGELANGLYTMVMNTGSIYSATRFVKTR